MFFNGCFPVPANKRFLLLVTNLLLTAPWVFVASCQLESPLDESPKWNRFPHQRCTFLGSGKEIYGRTFLPLSTQIYCTLVYVSQPPPSPLPHHHHHLWANSDLDVLVRAECRPDHAVGGHLLPSGCLHPGGGADELEAPATGGHHSGSPLQVLQFK